MSEMTDQSTVVSDVSRISSLIPRVPDKSPPARRRDSVAGTGAVATLRGHRMIYRSLKHPECSRVTESRQDKSPPRNLRHGGGPNQRRRRSIGAVEKTIMNGARRDDSVVAAVDGGGGSGGGSGNGLNGGCAAA